MNKVQRETWIALLLVVPVWAIFGQLPVLLIYLEGPSFLHLFSFACATIIGGLSWLLLLFFNRKWKRKAKIEFDERDKLILIRSTLAGYVVLWIYFITACIYVWLTASPDRSISVNVMPIVIVEGIAVFIFVQSVTTLIQYGRVGKNVEK
ncbi:MAG: hypothetical protein ACETWQ_00230 [Phycisphaerae bacterium]